MSLIIINKEKCTDCNECVRRCPVHAIRVNVGMKTPEIDDKRCIGCGTCITSCSQEAINYRDSIKPVKQLLLTEQKVAAIVDPSISGEFPDITDYRKFVEMIRALGFHYVNEVSFGVDLIARAYEKLFNEFKGKFYITANCPAIVYYVQKYYPGLVENLAPLVSPMVATAKVVRQVYGEDVKVVFIGPCIAAKTEAEQSEGDGKVNAVLTFTELRLMFKEKGIHEASLEFSDFDPPIGKLGSLYPLSNGFLQAALINENHLTGNIITEDGAKGSLEAVESFDKNAVVLQKNFNLFYDQGCAMGPGMSQNNDKHLRNALVIAYSRKRLMNFDHARWDWEMNRFAQIDLQKTFVSDDQRKPEPDEKNISEILRLIGKESNEAFVGCNSCGYKSCHDFAKAVSQGLTRTDMCLDYSIKSKEKYIGTLRETNKKLKSELDNKSEELKDLKTEFDLWSDKMDISRYIMYQIPSGVVFVDEKLKVLSANRSFIEILGDEAKEIDEIIPGLRGADLKTLVPVQFYKLFQNVIATGENIVSRDVKVDDSILNLSVFSIRENKVIGGIVRDMFAPEVLNEQIINRVTEVIDQNLKMVQQIGFLLGEGASKTEAMLNSIIQVHQKKKKA